MVSDLSPSQPFSLHNFSPHSLSWVPSAISVYYFLEGRQPSKGKYFRTYSSLFPSFASIWYQNLFSKHPSCSWKIFRIIWLSPSTLERFFFSLCHSGIGKDLMLCLLNSSWLLWWLRKRIRGNIANRTEDFVVVLSLARILVLCAIMLCVYTVMWLQNNTLAVTKVHGQEMRESWFIEDTWTNRNMMQNIQGQTRRWGFSDPPGEQPVKANAAN